jgi:hypothetical protein
MAEIPDIQPKKRGRPPKSASVLTGHCQVERNIRDGRATSDTAPEEFHLHCPGQIDRPDTPTGIEQPPFICSCPHHREENSVSVD